MITTVYKIVYRNPKDGTLHSYLRHPTWLDNKLEAQDILLEYPHGKWVKPKFGRIICFKTEAEAMDWSALDHYTDLVLYRAQTTSKLEHIDALITWDNTKDFIYLWNKTIKGTMNYHGKGYTTVANLRLVGAPIYKSRRSN